MVSAALLACGAGCKKSEAPAAEQAAPAPVAEQAPPAETTPPVAEQAAPPAEAPAPPVVQNPPPAQVTVAPTVAVLRGAPEVLDALNRKDYAGAVVRLSAVKAGLREDQRLEYNNLMRTVRESIVQAMDSNESARRAFQAMRAMEAGR
jgi:hypothetical protein